MLIGRTWRRHPSCALVHESGGGTMLSSGTVRMRPKKVLQAIYYFDHGEGSMKRYRFLQSGRRALPSLRSMLKGKSLTDNEANGIISDVVHGIFTRKAFAKMSQENLIPFPTADNVGTGKETTRVHRTRGQSSSSSQTPAKPKHGRRTGSRNVKR